MADTEVKLTLKSDADGVLSTLKDVKDSFESVGGIVGKIASFAIEAAEKIKQLQNEVRQMREDFEQAAVSIGNTSTAIEGENLKLKDQIAAMEGRPARNHLAIALLDASARAQELTASLRDALVKERDLLENQSVGFLKSLVTGQEGTTDLSDEFAPQIDRFIELLSEKQIAVADFNLKNRDTLAHGTAEQRKRVQAEFEKLEKEYDTQFSQLGTTITGRLEQLQKMLTGQKDELKKQLMTGSTTVAGDSVVIEEAKSEAEAQKQVNQQFQARQAVLDSLRLTILQLMQAESAEGENVQLRTTAAITQQVQHAQVVTIAAQKNRIQAVQQANQEEVAGYQQAFAAIDAAAQQFNNQQLTILMGGINRNSAQILQASQQRFKKLEHEEAASLQRRRKEFDRVFQGISGAFSTFVNGIISGNETMGHAWAKTVNDMASKFLSGLERQLVGYLEHKLMELSIHASTETAKDAASKAAHAKEDERTAYSAAKGAWESVVHTPIIGPILAPIAAASTFAAVTAFGSAEGGQYIVPSEQLTMLHRNEMVLPAGVAQKMRSVIDSGGGGGITVVVHHSVNAVDAESFQSHVRRHANMIGNEVARVLRKKKLAS